MLRAVFAAILFAGCAGAQGARQTIPPIRPLGRVVATTTVPIQLLAQIRVLSDGRVLVNDQKANHVLLFDSDLAHAKSIIDTTSETAKAYGRGGGRLFAYFGDSSLFLDVESWALLIIDPLGKVVGTVAAPPNPVVPALGPSFLLNTGPAPAFDGIGHIAYVNNLGRRVTRTLDDTVSGATAGPSVPKDSLPITRVMVRDRVLDTIAWLSRTASYDVRLPDGSRGIQAGNPIFEADEWTVLADGTVAIVRAHDYYIDWVGPDLRATSGPKIAHEWIHLTDSAKAALVDSARRVDSLKAVQDTIRQGGLKGMTAALGGMRGRGDPAGQAQSDITRLFYRRYVPPAMLPDYVPAFLASGGPPTTAAATATNAVMADGDNNVWIRVNLAHAPEGGPVYDVVNRAGALIDRVQIPGATTVVGFGPGVVYLAAREGTGTQLARARIR